jgi:hypothetical protein
MSDTTHQLEQVQQDFEKKKQQLEADYAKKKAELLQRLVKELYQAFEAGLKVYESVPDDFKAALYVQGDFNKILAKMGLLAIGPKKVKKSKTGGTARTSDDDILAFLAKERSTGELKEQFGWNNDVTPLKRLNALLAGGKVTTRKPTQTRYWKAK